MPKKRPYGSGSVTKRGDSYRLRYSGPPGADGERRQISESLKGVTKKEAERVLRERITAVEHGGFIPRADETVEQFAWRWFDAHAVPNTAPKTQQGYRQVLKAYILPPIGSVRLQTLGPSHLQEMYAGLQKRGLSARTVLFAHRVVHRMFKDAVRWNLITRNIADSVTPPKYQRQEMQVWTLDELRQFLAVAPDNALGALFELAILTGLRRAELTGLTWEDINLDERRLRVARTLQRITGRGLVIGAPKSSQSRRAVALGDRAVQLLRRVRVRQLEHQVAAGELYEESGYVFTNELGRPIDPDKVSKVFRRTVAKAGVPKLGIHSLRHLHATLALEQGIDMKVTSARLGHSQISITADLYSHVTATLQEDAARAVDDALAGV